MASTTSGTNSVSTNALAGTGPGTNAVVASASGTNSGRPFRSGPLGSLGPRTKPTDKPVVVKGRNEWLDVAWSLMNSEEFLYRH